MRNGPEAGLAASASLMMRSTSGSVSMSDCGTVITYRALATARSAATQIECERTRQHPALAGQAG